MQFIVDKSINLTEVINGTDQNSSAHGEIPLSIGSAKFDNFSVLTKRNMILTKDGGNNLVKVDLNIGNSHLAVPTNITSKQTTFPKGSFSWGSEFTGTRINPLDISVDKPCVFPTRKPNGKSTYVYRKPNDPNFYDLEIDNNGDSSYPIMAANYYNSEYNSISSELLKLNDTLIFDAGASYHQSAIIQLTKGQFVLIRDIDQYITLNNETRRSFIKELSVFQQEHLGFTKCQVYADKTGKLHFFTFFVKTYNNRCVQKYFKDFIYDVHNDSWIESVTEFVGSQIFMDSKTDTGFIYDFNSNNDLSSSVSSIYQFDLSTGKVIPLQVLEYDLVGNVVNQRFDGVILDSKDYTQSVYLELPSISSFVFVHNQNDAIVAAIFSINGEMYQIKRPFNNYDFDDASELMSDFTVFSNASLDENITSINNLGLAVNDKRPFTTCSKIMLGSDPIVYNGLTESSTDIEKSLFISKVIKGIFENPKRVNKILYNGKMLRPDFHISSNTDLGASIQDIVYNGGGLDIKTIHIFSGSIYNNGSPDNNGVLRLAKKHDMIDVLYITLNNGDFITMTSVLDTTAYGIPYMTTASENTNLELLPIHLNRCKLDTFKEYEIFHCVASDVLLIYDRFNDSFLFQHFDIHYYTDAYTPTEDYYGTPIYTAAANNISMDVQISNTTKRKLAVYSGSFRILNVTLYSDVNKGSEIFNTDITPSSYWVSPEFDPITGDLYYADVTFLTPDSRNVTVFGIINGKPEIDTLDTTLPVQPFFVFDPFIDLNRTYLAPEDNLSAFIRLGPNEMFHEDISVTVAVDGVANESLTKLYNCGFNTADDNMLITIPNLAPGEHTISFEAESITTPARAHATFSKTFTVPERMTLPTNIVATRDQANNTVTVSYDALPVDPAYILDVYVGDNTMNSMIDYFDRKGLMNIMYSGDSTIEKWSTNSGEAFSTHLFEGLDRFSGKEITVIVVIRDPTDNKIANRHSVTLNFDIIAVTGVTIDQDNYFLHQGQPEQLTATIEPANATNKNITWSSSDESVVTVDSTGLVTFVRANNPINNIIITATTEDGGFTDTANITVYASE